MRRLLELQGRHPGAPDDRHSIIKSGGALMLPRPAVSPVGRPLTCAALVVLASLTPACLAPIRLAFVVNQDHYTISATDLDQTAAYAHQALQAATGRGYTYKGAVFGHYGALDPGTIFKQYVLAHTADPADYVVIFTKHTQALEAGGFTLDAFGRSVDELKSELTSLPGFCNPSAEDVASTFPLPTCPATTSLSHDRRAHERIEHERAAAGMPPRVVSGGRPSRGGRPRCGWGDRGRRLAHRGQGTLLPPMTEDCRGKRCSMSRTAPLGLALGLLATAAVPASAQSKIVIDFEDQAPGQVIWNQYQGKGVLFPSRPMVIQHTLATHSGTHSLLSAPFSNEFDPGPLQVAFLAPQASVGVRLGLAKGAPSGTKILMRAYDKQQGGTLVTQSTTTIASPGPTAITTPLTVSAAKAVISRVEIEFSTANFEVVDDLEFDIAGSAPPPDTQAPVVTISTPAEAQVFTVANPQVPLAYTVADDGYLKQVSVLVKGPATQTQFTICGDGHAACWGAPPSLSANFWTLAFYGTNEVTVTAVDFGGNSGSATRKFTVAAPAAGPFDLLVITPEEFSSALSPLVAHKNATQMPATMLTLESIYNDITFSGARDVQEKVKRAIDRARRDWKTRYVMLVGDVDKLPVRYTRTLDPVSWGNGYSPSDLYYADLYDSKGVFDDWDSDDDGEYGEMNSGNPTGWSQLNQDGVDLEPDVAVGRIPASTALEVQRLVGRIISFEKSNPDQRILLVTGNFDDPHPTSNHVATILSQLGYTSVKHYWTTDWTTIPDSDPQWATKRANLLKAEIDKGVQFVTYLGHGAGGWPGTAGQNGGLWAGWYDYTRVPSLSNSGHYPIVLAAACDTAMFNYPHWPYQTKAGGQYTPVSGLPNSQQNAPEPAAVQPAQYDLDTMAEHFMLKSDVGAIAYYGAYTGVQPAAFKVIQRFFEELVALGGSATLGDVWAGGVKRYITYDFPAIPGYWGNWYASAIYHHIQKMMLFGDPSLRIGSQAGKSAFCQAHPQLCLTFKGSPIRYIYRGDPLRFVEAGARYVIAVDGLNQVFGAAEPLEGRWHEAILHLRARTGSVAASVYDDTGRLVAREQQVGDRATTIRLRGERGRKLLLVLAAGEGLRLDQAVELEVAARPVK